MAVMAECPICRKKQSAKNKRCTCGEDLDKAKRSRKVRYWIGYRMPNGKQRRESVGAFEGLNAYSKKDAETALSKRVVQKKEKRILDMLPESNMTFQELSDWYLGLSRVKKLASYRTVCLYVNKFNDVFGDRIVGDIRLEDLEEHQVFREGQGLKPASIDHEIGRVRTMLIKAFDNDKIDGPALKPFRRIRTLLDRGANARKRILSFEEYIKLLDSATPHFKPVLIVAYNTGMRSGELQKLEWSHIDRDKAFMRLPADITKENRDKVIPINYHVKTILEALPRAINHNFVFTHRGRPFTHHNGFVNQMKKTCEDSGVPYGRVEENGITMHDLRGTVKTNMLYAGVDKVYRDLILGHSLQGMDVHYLAPSEDTLKDAMEKFGDWLDEKLRETSKGLVRKKYVVGE